MADQPETAAAIAPKWPCTQCGRDATIAYSAKKGSDWGGKVKIGERLCLSCFRDRGGERFI
jgi:hypothetical protein